MGLCCNRKHFCLKTLMEKKNNLVKRLIPVEETEDINPSREEERQKSGKSLKRKDENPGRGWKGKMKIREEVKEETKRFWNSQNKGYDCTEGIQEKAL